MTWETAETIAKTLESIVTAGGIVAAGVWTYLIFVKRRQRFPRATVSHQTYHYRLTDGRTLLRVAAKVVNSGEVLVPMRFVRTRVQQFFPLPDHIASLASRADDSVSAASAEDCELPWTVLGVREWRIDEGLGEIEPGESEVLHCDFVIHTGVGQVLVYTYVTNHAKHDRDIGWSDTVVVLLKEGEPYGTPAAAARP
jgi:hypothetical protein